MILILADNQINIIIKFDDKNNDNFGFSNLS